MRIRGEEGPLGQTGFRAYRSLAVCPLVCAQRRHVREVTAKLLDPFREQHIPLIGIVNAGQCRALSNDDLRKILDMWLAAGAERYLAARGDQVAPVTLDNSGYMFAAVYASALNRGDRQMAERVKRAYSPYLESIFAFFEQRSMEVVGHDVPQILLLHVSKLNAGLAPALIAMMQSRRYSFISLERALKDAA